MSMAEYKFVAECYFDAEDMSDALAKLGEHFTKLSKGEVSHLLKEGSFCAYGEPEFDEPIRSQGIIDWQVMEAYMESQGVKAPTNE